MLEEVRDSLGIGPGEAALLTSLPVLAFAVFGALAPAAASRIGPHRVTALALVAAVTGLSARVLTDSDLAFLALSLLAVAGMAMANVLLPSLVKRHAPERIGQVTALYTTTLAVGLTAALVLTVPFSELGGSWRWGLGVWALLAAAALVPWLLLARTDRGLEPVRRTVTFAQVARTRVGAAMALFFGLQALQAYVIFGWFAQLWRDHGFTGSQAGLLLGVVTGISIPLSFVLPRWFTTTAAPLRVLLLVIGCYPVAYVGLLVAPHTLAVLWAALAGVGTCTFPLILTLVGLRARTPEGTAALSAFTQAVGYLVAATGPFTVGLLYEATDAWTAPLALLLVLVAPMVLLAVRLSRASYVEDELVP
ncbi:MAG: MFS transporter [Actinobacteria bacterium]|nr:MFS transporter [Actinomycetota bacterium]